ncbi:MAG: LLM class flavin-dependent oxidoreductase, partial [Acidimicrobiia bacterium]|nr:LLM class flavin-dependent oxidoreductase [Acidimicrobiia bacterium]
CLTEDPFTGHDGTFCSVPPRNVVPKPMQTPHPPLWVACSRRDTILMAAEKGLGALTFAFIDPEEAQQWVQDYTQVMAESCVPVGKAVNPQIACVTPMMCHPDEARAIEMGLEGGNFFGYSLAHYYVFGEHVPGQTDVWSEFQQKRSEHGYDPAVAVASERETLGAKIAEGDTSGLRGAVGTPDQIREFLRRYEQAGVDQLIFVMQAGRNRHEDICESLERFGTEILPEFAERDAATEKARDAKWAPIVEAAMARRVDDAPPMPAGFSMKALPKQIVDAGMGKEFGFEKEQLEDLARRQALGQRDPDAGILG